MVLCALRLVKGSEYEGADHIWGCQEKRVPGFSGLLALLRPSPAVSRVPCPPPPAPEAPPHHLPPTTASRMGALVRPCTAHPSLIPQTPCRGVPCGRPSPSAQRPASNQRRQHVPLALPLQFTVPPAPSSRARGPAPPLTTNHCFPNGCLCSPHAPLTSPLFRKPPVGASLVGAQAPPRRDQPPIRDANTSPALFPCSSPCPSHRRSPPNFPSGQRITVALLYQSIGSLKLAPFLDCTRE